MSAARSAGGSRGRGGRAPPRGPARSPRGPAIGLPVEAGPERVDAVNDAVKLLPAIAAGRVQFIKRRELRQVAQAVLGGLGHGHLAVQEAAITLPGMDPESLGRLLGIEARNLPRRQGAEEEARGEANGAGAGSDK